MDRWTNRVLEKWLSNNRSFFVTWRTTELAHSQTLWIDFIGEAYTFKTKGILFILQVSNNKIWRIMDSRI